MKTSLVTQEIVGTRRDLENKKWHAEKLNAHATYLENIVASKNIKSTVFKGIEDFFTVRDDNKNSSFLYRDSL